MMQWPLSEATILAILTLVFAGAPLATWVTVRTQKKMNRDKLALERSLKTEDIAAAGLKAQLDAWSALLVQVREYADDLEAQLNALRVEIRDMRAEMSDLRARHEECERNLKEHQRRLAALERPLPPGPIATATA